jgi:ankyrin repeat protein
MFQTVKAFRTILSSWSVLAVAIVLTGSMTIPGADMIHAQNADLLRAAANGDAAAIAKLLRQGTTVDIRDPSGNTPLLLATTSNHTEVARLLIEAGANVNLQNDSLDSAYLLAGAQGRLEILRMTLQHGADLKSTNRFGGTALIPACERGHVEVVQALLQAGVDPDHINRLGWTGLLEAVILGNGGPRHQAIVRLLIDGGTNINLADHDGVTPLQHARRRNQDVVVKMLVAAGAY